MSRISVFLARLFNGKKMKVQQEAQEKQLQLEKYVKEYQVYRTMIVEAERPSWAHIFRLEDIRQHLHSNDLGGIMLCDEAIQTLQSRASLLGLVTPSDIKRAISWNRTHVDMATSRLARIAASSYNDVVLGGVLRQVRELECLKNYEGYSNLATQVTMARGMSEFLARASSKQFALSGASSNN